MPRSLSLSEREADLDDPASRSPLTDAIRARLHRATSADVSTVRDLVREACAKWVPLLGREPEPMTADHDAAVRDHVVDVLRLDRQAAALIEMEPEDDHLLVVNVAVSPDYQAKVMAAIAPPLCCTDADIDAIL